MKLTVPYTYTSSVIPPRCRKPRNVRQQATMTLTIHEVTAQEAPVAIIAHDADWAADIRYSGQTPPVYRWWRHSLYQRYCRQEESGGPWVTQDASSLRQRLEHPSRYHYENRGCASQQEQRNTLRRWTRHTLLIDGERWDRSGEPRYVVMTFGLGHNHGLGWGTSLSTDTGYNSNIPAARYFRCDQYEQAVAAATAIAEARGDTKALPIAQQAPTRYEILIPEAVRLRPHREHGQGDAFMRKVEALIEHSSSAGMAGIVLMASL